MTTYDQVKRSAARLDRSEAECSSASRCGVADAVATADETATPWSTKETRALIRALWQEVLEAPVQEDDKGFFELGGNSLAAARMLSALERQTGIHVSLPEFVRNQTPAALAGSLLASRATALPVRVERADRGEAAKLTPVQKVFFLLHNMGLGPTLNIRQRMVIRGPLDAQLLEDSLRHVAGTHQALRIKVERRDGELVCVDRGSAEFPLEHLDARELTPTGLEDYFRSFVVRPLEPREGPLLRALLARTQQDTHQLVIAINHLVCDGWSIQLILRRIFETYAALHAGRTPSEFAVDLDFLDFLRVRSALVPEARVKEGEAYWVERFERPAKPLQLAAGKARPDTLSNAGASLFCHIDDTLVEQLRVSAGARGATPYCWLLAIYKVLLSRESGTSDIVVCTPMAGREEVEIAETVGIFMNGVLIRTTVDASQRFDSLVREVQDSVAHAAENQHFPTTELLLKIVADGDPMRLLGMYFAYTTWGSVTKDPFAPALEAGLQVERQRLSVGTRRNELSVDVTDHGRGLQVEFRYSTDLFDAPVIDRLAKDYLALVESTLTNPAQVIAEL